MNCPSYGELLAAFSDPTNHREILSRTQDGSCPECSRRVERVRFLWRNLARGPLPEVSPQLHQRALDVGTGSAVGDLFERVREYVAHLIYDSFQSAPVAALRGRSITARHLLYSAGPYEVDLALTESGSVVGQVLGSVEDRRAMQHAICVLSGEAGTFLSQLESNGDFHFEGVGPGSYSLELEGPSLRVVVPDFEFSCGPRDPGDPS